MNLLFHRNDKSILSRAVAIALVEIYMLIYIGWTGIFEKIQNFGKNTAYLCRTGTVLVSLTPGIELNHWDRMPPPPSLLSLS